MRCTLMLFLALAATTAPAAAQAAPPDSQVTQAVLAQIRELREDLRNAAATIQRVQIVMFRLQVQAAVADKAAQRLDQARNLCKQAQEQQKSVAIQIEQTEARRRNSQKESDQRAAEQLISQLQSYLETFAGGTERCQVEQIEAETQSRAEQSKMNELQEQLDQLDQVLAGQSKR